MIRRKRCDWPAVIIIHLRNFSEPSQQITTNLLSEKLSERVKEIVTENKLTHIKKENEALKAKASMKPLVLAFISPFTSLAYNVSFILTIRYRLYHIVGTPGLIIVSADTCNIKFRCIGCSYHWDATSNQFSHR